MFHLYTPWKRQKASAFLTFSGGIEIEHWLKNGLRIVSVQPRGSYSNPVFK